MFKRVSFLGKMSVAQARWAWVLKARTSDANSVSWLFKHNVLIRVIKKGASDLSTQENFYKRISWVVPGLRWGDPGGVVWISTCGVRIVKSDVSHLAAHASCKIFSLYISPVVRHVVLINLDPEWRQFHFFIPCDALFSSCAGKGNDD